MDTRRILAALCCRDGRPSGHVLDWLGRLAGRYNISVFRADGFTEVEHAENVACREFLAGDWSHLWFVANDLVPYAATHRVLELETDIALGWSFVNDPKALLGVWPNVGRAVLTADGRRQFRTVSIDSSALEPIEVDVGGMHCAVIARHVLCDPRMLQDATYLDADDEARTLTPEDEDYAPPFFRQVRRPDGFIVRTDDYDFCWRARQLGYRVLVHPAACSGHLMADDIVARYAVIRGGDNNGL